MTRLTPAPLAGPVSERVLREFHLEYQRRLSAGCAARLHWSAERLRDHRRHSLGELLSMAREQSPWHRRRLAGIDSVDERGEAVPPGARSAKILITALHNHALPLIRYELDDEVTVLPGTCPCGSRHTLIEDVQGVSRSCHRRSTAYAT